jgi:hypothetical protein
MVNIPDLCRREDLLSINRFVHVRFVCQETIKYCKIQGLNKSNTRQIFKKVQKNLVKNPSSDFETCKALGLGLDISGLTQYIDLLILEHLMK